MNTRDEIREELSEMSPMLEKIDRKNPFRVPDYYFQSLPDKLMEKVKSSPALWTDRMENWLNNFFALIFRPRYAIPVTALLLSLVVGINFVKNNQNAQFDISQPLSEIPSEEIDEYVVENFDDADLVALTGSTDLSNGIIPLDITSEDLEDYLQNNSDNQNLEEDIL